jgi:DNA-binding response OmpR family regulator
MKEILLLEDDRAYRESIAEYLVQLGFKVDAYGDGDRAYDALFEHTYQLALLDIRVPGRSGLEILRSLREEGISTAVILVTSLVDIDDLSIGYELGCNDYIRKPFELQELKHRVTQALSRVTYGSIAPVVVLRGGYRFEPATRQMFCGDGPVALTRREGEVVAYLVAQKNRWVEPEELRCEVWEMKEIAYADIRMTISRIRRKCGKELIASARGLGYRIEG